jgi:uncharacterized repeat protein (TIGR01451 family)
MKIVSLLILSLGFGHVANCQFTEEKPLAWYPETHFNLAIADTDNDGHYDILTSSVSKGPRIITNNGDNSFAFPVSLTEYGANYNDHKFADIDLDGDLDIISVRPSLGFVSLFTNNGENVFTETIIYDSPGSTGSIEVADINNDGYPDLSFRKDFSDIIVAINDGLGAFTLTTVLSDLSYNFKHHINFNVNADFDKDLVIFDYPSSSLLYCENLGGAYADPVVITTDAYALDAMEAIDIDEDGDLDVLYTNPASERFMILENLGGGAFADATVFLDFINPRLAEPVDIDNDGKLDVVLHKSALGHTFYWMRNLGDGAFEAPDSLCHNYGTGKFDFYDYDADGDPDMFYVESAASVELRENLGGGEFGETEYISETAIEIHDIHPVDIDLDGDLDLFSASNVDQKVAWVENLGDGNFSHLNMLPPSELYDLRSVITSDIDGDLDPDLICSVRESDKVVWFENLGGGEFGTETIITESQNGPTCTVSYDWDADGDNDVIVASDADGQIVLYENVGGTFLAGELVCANGWVIGFNSSDLDEDGDMDIVYAAYGDDEVRWLENTGDLTFVLHTIASELVNPYQLSTADFDHDGDPDILVSVRDENKVIWIENTGAGTFADELILVTGSDGPVSSWFKDVNNDGLKDLVVGSQNDNTIGWYENMGDLTFSDRNIISNNIEYVMDVITEDLDGDGDYDVAAVSYTDSKFVWFENMTYANHLVKGKIFHDENENGELDEGETGVNYAQAMCDPISYFSYTSFNGDYRIAFDEVELGDYTIFPEPIEYWAISTETSYDVTIDGEFTLYENLDFGIYITEIVDQLDAHLTGGIPRIDTEVNFWINYSNTGTTIPNGTIHLELDEELTYLSSEIEPELIDGQHLYWNYADLAYFEDRGFKLTVLMPNFESIGNEITSFLTVDIEELDEPVFSAVDSLVQVIQGAYDPNDKSVRPAGEGEFGYIPQSTQSLEYLIRFQNTGTDTAFQVVVTDQLDENLDWTSLSPLAWSHDMEIEVSYDGEISFIFDNIMLPDSNVNQIASNGFIKYEIDLLPDLPLGTAIYNTANIYFDLNPAVITNTTLNTLRSDSTSVLSEENKFETRIFPNPFTDYTTVSFSEELLENHTILIFDIMGKEVYRNQSVSGLSVQIQKRDLGAGLYILHLLNPNQEELFSTKLLVE